MSKKSKIITACIVTIIVLTIVLVSVNQWFKQPDSHLSDYSQNQVRVIATIFPVADLAKQVVGDNGIVTQLIPNSVDPHTYSPTPEDIVALSQANALIYLGDEQEPWVRSLLESINNPKLIVINLGNMQEGGQEIQGQKESILESNTLSENVFDSASTSESAVAHIQVLKEGNQVDTEHVAEHEHNDNFHFWLDFDLTQQALQLIADQLSPTNTELSSRFQTNQQLAQAQWVELAQNYQSGLENCQTRILVYAGHSAFGHLAEDYGLELIDGLSVSANAEVTPQTLSNMIDLLAENHSLAVFTDVFFSPKLAETMAEESGLPVLRLNPGERWRYENGQNPDGGLLEIMEANLNKLQEGLGCE